MYNKIILAGNLTRDIEITYTPTGTAIGKSAIATSRKFKAQDGQQKEEVTFIDITFYGRTAEIANQYIRKGSKVLIEGILKLDQWTAQDGTKRSKHSVSVKELKMLGDSNSNGGSRTQENNQGGYGVEYQDPSGNTEHYHHVPQNEPQSSYPEIDINEDEIPF